MMDHHSACTEAIRRLRGGDEAASAEVFDRFIARLLALAEGRLHPLLCSRLDPDDVVQSVFRTFFRRCAEGQFTLLSWDNVWQVLASITARKCARHNRRLGRKILSTDAPNELALHAAFDREPTPEESAAFLDTLEELMRDLPPCERAIFALRLQGHGTRDISNVLGCTIRKVQRVLQHIRKRLERMNEAASGAGTC